MDGILHDLHFSSNHQKYSAAKSQQLGSSFVCKIAIEPITVKNSFLHFLKYEIFLSYYIFIARVLYVNIRQVANIQKFKNLNTFIDEYLARARDLAC